MCVDSLVSFSSDVFVYVHVHLYFGICLCLCIHLSSGAQLSFCFRFFLSLSLCLLLLSVDASSYLSAVVLYVAVFPILSISLCLYLCACLCMCLFIGLFFVFLIFLGLPFLRPLSLSLSAVCAWGPFPGMAAVAWAKDWVCSPGSVGQAVVRCVPARGSSCAQRNLRPHVISHLLRWLALAVSPGAAFAAGGRAGGVGRPAPLTMGCNGCLLRFCGLGGGVSWPAILCGARKSEGCAGREGTLRSCGALLVERRRLDIGVFRPMRVSHNRPSQCGVWQPGALRHRAGRPRFVFVAPAASLASTSTRSKWPAHPRLSFAFLSTCAWSAP